MPPKIKAQDLAVTLGLASTRSQAQALILAGRILYGAEPVPKAGTLYPEDAILTLKEGRKYASRGGFKLAGALEAFNLDVTGFNCLDAGASTGGFTDCLLQKGANKVTAADVGQGLLDYNLRLNPQVKVVENLNLRLLTPQNASELDPPFDLITLDLSFISLELVLPVLAPLTKENGYILALVKPQFELGRGRVGKKGVVKDPKLIQEAADKIVNLIPALKPTYKVLGEAPAAITGANGNQEIFVLSQRA
ncbi:MAG: TlyA family RNA methyltransferase [Deltaproteobacteria bacterium]|jgi:23S rRNA (cytidine1920-2'-O)/16S rRNA (cytidine1409-2'-O)-methyltransferase|nr:TlyA family RNA methyltransferase [Deltaproteobacteria bacterium]